MKLYESLFIMYKSNISIQRLWKVIEVNQERILEIQNTAVLLTHYITMETVTFMQEFEGGFYNNIEPEYKQRMMDVRKITEPIIKKIKWRKLREYRNNIIAHPWRDKKGNFILPDDSKYDVPTNWFETGVLVKYVEYTFDIILNEFKEEFIETIDWVKKLSNPDSPQKDISNINQELYDLAKEVSAICKELNKPYHLKVHLYEMDGIKFNKVKDNKNPGQ